MNAKDPMVKANFGMWDLMVGQLDKQLQELKQAEASRQDMEARRGGDVQAGGNQVAGSSQSRTASDVLAAARRHSQYSARGQADRYQQPLRYLFQAPPPTLRLLQTNGKLQPVLSWPGGRIP